LRISVRVGICGVAGAAVGAWPELVAGAFCAWAGATGAAAGIRGALVDGGFGAACATLIPSAGAAGSAQNQNAHADNPIRNPHAFIEGPLTAIPARFCHR
jgi:hypothetical protein